MFHVDCVRIALIGRLLLLSDLQSFRYIVKKGSFKAAADNMLCYGGRYGWIRYHYLNNLTLLLPIADQVGARVVYQI